MTFGVRALAIIKWRGERFVDWQTKSLNLKVRFGDVLVSFLLL
jgi:hypothetical protein